MIGKEKEDEVPSPELSPMNLNEYNRSSETQ